MISTELMDMCLLLISYHSYQLIEHAVIGFAFGCVTNEVDIEWHVKYKVPAKTRAPTSSRSAQALFESAFKTLHSYTLRGRRVEHVCDKNNEGFAAIYRIDWIYKVQPAAVSTTESAE